MAEFQDDREAVKELVVAAQTGRFDHVLAVFREDREEAEARQGRSRVDQAGRHRHRRRHRTRDGTVPQLLELRSAVMTRRSPTRVTSLAPAMLPTSRRTATTMRTRDEGKWVTEVDVRLHGPGCSTATSRQQALRQHDETSRSTPVRRTRPRNELARNASSAGQQQGMASSRGGAP